MTPLPEAKWFSWGGGGSGGVLIPGIPPRKQNAPVLPRFQFNLVYVPHKDLKFTWKLLNYLDP
jgi:hypothetical protein